MINLNIANENDGHEPPQPARKFFRLSGPTRPLSSSTGSPLIPTPPVLVNFGRRPNPGGVKVNRQVETPPPPTPPGELEKEEGAPLQETGRVPVVKLRLLGRRIHSSQQGPWSLDEPG
jgi:hypothetical protein